MLRKGPTWIKIDPFYQPQSVCASQPRARADERGCFLLIHNNPAPGQWYYTLDDVLDFVSDPQFLSYFTVRSRVGHV